jgi:hypothetical protein
MVAVKDGSPVEVPRLICETNEEKARFLMGLIRREMRKQRIAQLAEIEQKLLAADTAQLDEWMKAANPVDLISSCLS